MKTKKVKKEEPKKNKKEINMNDLGNITGGPGGKPVDIIGTRTGGGTKK